MKKITSFAVRVIIVLISIISLTTAQAQITVASGGGGSSGQQYMDSEELAQGFLSHDSDHYAASLQSVQNGGGQYYYIDMVLDGNLFITNMTVNGTNVSLQEPLSGIPVPESGYPNAFVNVTALDKYGNTASTGQFQTNYLAEGSSIKVMMTPKFPPVAIQLEKGLDSNSINVSLTGTTGGWGWSYDPSTGLLTIDVWDPSTTDIGYVIKDGAGGLLAHGTLPFFQPMPGAGTATDSVFNLQNAGGYVSMPLGINGYNNANGLKFNSYVKRNGQYDPAKVIGVPDLGYQSKLYVWVGSYYNGTSISNAKIEVHKWAASGPMELVPSSMVTDSYGDTTLITSNYVDRVVVTVLPGKDSTMSNLYVGRTY